MLNRILLVVAFTCLLKSPSHGGDDPLFKQRLEHGELIIRLIPADFEVRSSIVPAAKIPPGPQHAGLGHLAIPVTYTARRAYELYYTNSTSKISDALWIGLIINVKEGAGFEGQLSKADKLDKPFVFHGAFFDPTSSICALHFRNGGGEEIVWFADSLTKKRKDLEMKHGIAKPVPDQRPAKASRFHFDASSRKLRLDVEYDGADGKSFLVSAVGLQLISVNPKE